mmetsp:Transcript_63262/g.137995  ORF Transcript_63262/g.137995 Transcript_63262/m.137995 type:complete len:87 (+) Transcript_63262:614-874(+)
MSRTRPGPRVSVFDASSGARPMLTIVEYANGVLWISTTIAMSSGDVLLAGHGGNQQRTEQPTPSEDVVQETFPSFMVLSLVVGRAS